MRTLVCALLLTLSCSVCAAEQSWSFDALLSEMSLSYEQPTGWNTAKQVYSTVESNKVLVAPNGQAELHLILRPISLMNIDYDDPHSSAPNPNEVFPLLFDSITQRYSNHDNTRKSEFKGEQATAQFNANWAAASVFGLKDDISEVYSEALLIAIHRHNQGDAYLMVLSNDLSTIKPLITSAQTALIFQEASQK